MSIKHAILAILTEEPAHGYELKKRFDDALGDFWPLRQAQIYNNLRLLEKAEFIELDAQVVQDGLPDRKLFRPTEAGKAELQKWLSAPIQTNRKLKDDLYLKLTTLINVLDNWEAVTDLLWQQRQVYLQSLRDLEHTLIQVERSNDTLTATLIEGAILHIEADLAWLDRVEERFQHEQLAQKGGAE